MLSGDLQAIYSDLQDLHSQSHLNLLGRAQTGLLIRPSLKLLFRAFHGGTDHLR